MTCCASLLFLLSATQPLDTVPASFATRVRGEIAARWSVEASALQLQWDVWPEKAIVDTDTPFHLSGRGNDGWLVVVVEPPRAAPHAIRVRAGVLRRVPVATHALRRGALLAATDFAVRNETIWSALDAAAPAGLEGWEAKRDIAEGTVLSTALLAAPRMIAAGDPVRFVWSDHGVQVERIATAIGPARLGEVVQATIGAVRLSGIVTGTGVAQLKGGFR